MDCQHLEDLYELFLLGALPEQSSAELREHLERGCASCLERVRDAAQTVYLLSLKAKAVRLNPKLKARLLQQLPKRT